MVRLLIQNWWLMLLRGIVALAFAIFVFLFQPFLPSGLLRPMAHTALAVIFGLLACGTGILTLAAALRGARKPRDTALLVADGLVATAAGAAVLLIPSFSLSEVIHIVAITALLLGILELVAGSHLRRHLKDEWLLLAGGAVSFAFSLFLLINRTWELASAVIWVGIYAGAAGLAMIGLALRLRGLRYSIHALAEHTSQPPPSSDTKVKAASRS
jgi:uncharacterized membrane protein HdeD (DUF308 family)